jgi:uncharacterized protein (TIGR00299 family) protein
MAPVRVLHFDPFAGASGDMVLGALADAGAEVGAIGERLKEILPFELSLETAKVVRRGIAGTHADVRIHEHHAPHRGLHDLLHVLEGAALPDVVRERSERTFRLLAEAEARVHGKPADEIHFHEVGAGDTLVDVIGSHLAIHDLGVNRITCGTVAVGSGTVLCAHGELPVPAPATAEILKGVPIGGTSATGELTTPTGAALLVTLAESFGGTPRMATERIGYGFGTRDDGPMPNALRVFLGRAEVALGEGEVVVLETTVDDMSGEVAGYVFDALFKAGALDVTTVPAGMKKSRPGTRITVIGEPADERRLAEVMFRETTTFGIRVRVEKRLVLERRVQRVVTQWGEVGVKIGRMGESDVQAAPEYEDCRRIADASGVSLRRVQQAALDALNRPDRGGASRA